MKPVHILALVAAAVLMAVTLLGAQAPASDAARRLPSEILAAFQKSYPKATITGVSKETEDGKTVWEVESTDNGLGRDLVYAPDGTVMEIEEEIAASSLPAAVSAALNAKYPSAAIAKAEKLTRGEAVQYEIRLTGADVRSVELRPDGTPVPKKQ